jgi:hypothetical protein
MLNLDNGTTLLAFDESPDKFLEVRSRTRVSPDKFLGWDNFMDSGPLRGLQRCDLDLLWCLSMSWSKPLNMKLLQSCVSHYQSIGTLLP